MMNNTNNDYQKNQQGYYDAQGVYHYPQEQNQQMNNGYQYGYPQQPANPQYANQYQNAYVQQPVNAQGENYQNNYPQYQQQYQQYQQPAPKEKKKKFNWLSLVIYAVVAIVVGVIISIADGNTTDELLGTWTHSYDMQYDEGLTFKLTENLTLTEGEYLWSIDEDKTKAAIMSMYDELLASEGITEEDVKLSGYSSMQAFKEEMLEEDYKSLLDIYNSEPSGGTWRIEKGDFIFKEEGDTTEYQTEYEIDGDTLYLKTDEITLTRVK